MDSGFKENGMIGMKENGMKGNIGAISAPRQRAAKAAVLRIPVLAVMALTALVALAFVSCSKKGAEAGKQAEALETIRLGVMTDSVTAYAADIGNAEGIFAKHGLDVDVASFAAGINTIDAVTTGQMDIGFGADFAVLNRLGGSPNTPLRIFTGLGEGALDSWKLYARGADIQSPADLVGKPVVTRLGTVEEYWHARTFEASGISLSAVNFLPVDATMEGVALIQNGSAAAMWANARPAEALNRIEGVHPIADLSAAGTTISFAVATEDFLTKRQGAAVKYLQAMEEIYGLINGDPARAAEIVNRVSSTPVAQTVINLQSSVNYIDFTQAVFEATDSLYRWAEGSGVIKYPYEPRRYINTDALRAAFPGRGSFN